MRKRTKAATALAGGALLLTGFGAGAVVAVTGSASAAGDAVSSTVSETARNLDPTNLDPSRSMRPDEHLLSGTTATKVKAAALAKYPKATVQRVETDSEGVYEAHIVTADGSPLIVQVGKDFTVTGTEAFGGRGGHGFGDRDGDGPGDAPSGAAPSTSGYGA